MHDQLQHVADSTQLADIMLFGAEDGPARGSRFLVGRTISGLNFRIAVDRGFDLVDLDYKGIPLGWRGPTGFPAPALHAPDAERGLSKLRAFSGFLLTCGWDHFGAARSGPSTHHPYALRDGQDYPLHGRATSIPATLSSYGVDINAPEPVVFAEAILRQAAMFGEVYEVKRRITFGILEPRVNLTDHLTNLGRNRSPLRVLYHINLGYPLVDDGCAVSGVPDHEDMPTPMPPLDPRDTEHFRCLERSDVDDTITVMQPNRPVGVALHITMLTASFSHVVQWWNRYPGMNVLGIEPASAAFPGPDEDGDWHPDAWLDPGASQTYALQFSLEECNQ